MSHRTISFGFLLCPIQALDMVGPMDLLFNISREAVAIMGPQKLEEMNPPVFEFHHIGPDEEAVQLTGRLSVKPTTTIKDCPKLDYLLIGGSMPDYAMNLPEPMKKFIIERSKEVKAIFTTCTGGLILSSTGLLDGLEATTNHMCLGFEGFPHFGNMVSPKTVWSKEKQWVISKGQGVEFWTGAGAVAGMDMMAQWVREEFSNGSELLSLSTAALDYMPRDVDARSMPYVNGRFEMVKA